MSQLALKERHLQEIDAHISHVKTIIEEQTKRQERSAVFNEILQSWFAIRELTLSERDALRRKVGPIA